MRSPLARPSEPYSQRCARIAEDGAATLRAYARALAVQSERIDGAFVTAVVSILATPGHVIVAGVGKSGLVGRKIAATLASTGTPSFFVHATEALHGDLGMCTPEDIALLISYSGETEEVVALALPLKRLGLRTIALVGAPRSRLAQRADVVLDIGVEREACPHNLAPTTSSLATLAIGDALAIALMRERGFNADDFARLHPGGSLGRRLLGDASMILADTAETLIPRR